MHGSHSIDARLQLKSEYRISSESGCLLDCALVSTKTDSTLLTNHQQVEQLLLDCCTCYKGGGHVAIR